MSKFFSSEIPAPEKLKPCPFCGNKAIFTTITTNYGRSGCGFTFDVKCAKCNTSAPASKVFGFNLHLMDDGSIRITKDERQEAVTIWNKRGGDDK